MKVSRSPMPRGEKKTWRLEGRGEGRVGRRGEPLSSLVVTSTSEEGRLDQVRGEEVAVLVDGGDGGAGAGVERRGVREG